MLRIRLRRVGKKKQPNYRVVIADSRAPRDGAFIETIGTYNPLTDPATVNIDEEKAREWLGKGAVPSDRVREAARRQGHRRGAGLRTEGEEGGGRRSPRDGVGRTMKDIIEFIAKALVDHPDDVKVTEEEERGRVVVRLEVAEDDYGKVIGKGGRIAQAMRAMLKISAVRHDEYASLEIGD